MSCEWDLRVYNPEISASPIVTKWVRRGGGFSFLCDIDSFILLLVLLLFLCETWNFRTALGSQGGAVYQGLLSIPAVAQPRGTCCVGFTVPGCCCPFKL